MKSQKGKLSLVYLLIIASLVSVGSMLAYAEPAEGQKPILDVIRDQGDYLPTDNVYDKSKYGIAMEGYDLSDVFMVKVYLGTFLNHVDKPMEELKEQMREDLGILHVSFLSDNRIETFREWRGMITRELIDENYRPWYVYNFNLDDEYPKFVQDVLNSSIYQSKLHLSDTKYTEIVCFTGEMNHQPTCVYYIGDNRTIVRCYPNYFDEGFDLLLEDYKVYAAAYCEMQRSNGHLDGVGSFLHFVDNHTVEEAKEYYEKAKAERLEKQNSTDSEGVNVLVWILPAAAILLVGGAVAFVTYRKKKTKS